MSESSVVRNVLAHGTGAIHIDACRVGSGQGGSRDGESTQEARYTKDGSTNFAMKPGPRGGDKKGRFPANLVLEHLPECRRAGVRKVKGISGGASSGDNAFGQDSGWNAHENRPTDISRQMDADGMETVDAWYCVPGCPVADLDEQMPEAGAFAPVASRDTPKTRDIYGKFENNGDDGRTFQGDKGGASRFFKQVRGGRDS